MKLQGKVFVGIGGFLAVLAVVYWFASYEDAGAVLLTASAILTTFAGLFFLKQERDFGDEIGDDEDAEMSQSVGDVGRFPSGTAWPLVLGLGVVITFNGLAAPNWVLLIGGLILGVGLVGYMFSTVWSSSD